MPWGWILCALLIPAGLLLLALALFHVRVRASWGGAWESLDSSQGGSFQVEYGFPGFMRKWDGAKNTEAVGSGLAEEDAGAWSDPVGSDVPPRNAKDPQRDIPVDSTGGLGMETAHARAGTIASSAPASSSPPPRKSRSRRRSLNRWRRALFRLATDRQTWRLFARYGFGTARGALRLLKPRIAVAVGHPDPVKLGRLAGYWHATAPFLSATPATLELRFQDRRPTLAVRAEGGFSALSLLLFALGRITTFPWIGLGFRAWHGWRGHELKGWRKWAYKKLQG